MDIESWTRWYDYSRARDMMLDATDTEHAPWYIVRSDDKKRARLNCIAHLLSLIPYEEVPRKKVKLPKRSSKDKYDDQATLDGGTSCRKSIEQGDHCNIMGVVEPRKAHVLQPSSAIGGDHETDCQVVLSDGRRTAPAPTPRGCCWRPTRSQPSKRPACRVRPCHHHHRWEVSPPQPPPFGGTDKGRSMASAS